MSKLDYNQGYISRSLDMNKPVNVLSTSCAYIYIYSCQLDLSNFQAMVQIHLLSNDNFPNFQTMFQIHVLSNNKNRNLEQEGKHESQI